MKNNNVTDLVQKQRQFFLTGATKPLDYRLKKLQLLYQNIQKYETEIIEALQLDLGKSAFESFETEIGIVLLEITHTLKNLRRWVKPKKVKTPMLHFPSKSYILKEPFGVSLIIAPWNYPFQLAIAPLIGSIAAGNCAIIKPSEYALHTSTMVQKIVDVTFEKEHVSVVPGDAEIAKRLLKEQFDYIFFTGGTQVGKMIMHAASETLTPLTLELGGKSPCIVDETADITLSAKRIVWGKFVNAGQTCVAPDYILVHKSKKNALVENMKLQIKTLYGQDILNNPDYPRIINQKHYDRLCALMNYGKIVAGGDVSKASLKITPTLIEDVKWAEPIMQEEIFGPLLPFIVYDSLEEIIRLLQNMPKPLALYYFTTNKQRANVILSNISFGGGCINDTLIHFSNANLPFGGVGTSGLGAYHGKASFESFSHTKSMMKKMNYLDIPLRYPPFKNHLAVLKKFMR